MICIFFFSTSTDDLGDESFEFRFTNDGHGDIGYNIFNFRRDTASGQYQYVKVHYENFPMQYTSRKVIFFF